MQHIKVSFTLLSIAYTFFWPIWKVLWAVLLHDEDYMKALQATFSVANTELHGVDLEMHLNNIFFAEHFLRFAKGRWVAENVEVSKSLVILCCSLGLHFRSLPPLFA